MCACVCVCVHTVFCTACVSVERTPLPGAAALSDESSQAKTSRSPFSPLPSLLRSAPSCSSSSSSASSPTDVLWRRRASPAFVFTEVRLCPAHRHMCDSERSVRRQQGAFKDTRLLNHQEGKRTHGGGGTAQERLSPQTPTCPTFIVLWRDLHTYPPARTHTHTSDDSRFPKEVGC